MKKKNCQNQFPAIKKKKNHTAIKPEGGGKALMARPLRKELYFWRLPLQLYFEVDQKSFALDLDYF